MGKNSTTLNMRKAVLVVDDDPDLVQLISTMLKGYEFDLLWAPDIPRARDIISARRIAVLIVDHYLGEHDGMVLVKECRANPATANTPILVMSQEVTTALVSSIKVHGVTDLLLKPFDGKRLRKGIAKAISTMMIQESNNRIH
jgi:DNA-binding response OmpR family regulator